jgi:hypothetical protein
VGCLSGTRLDRGAGKQHGQGHGDPHRGESRLGAGEPAAPGRRPTFTEWLDARAGGRGQLADFYRARFRAEFKPAFAAWLATYPFTAGGAPSTPFDVPQYSLRAETRADRLEVAAAADSDRAKDANQRSTNYMLGVVLLATALFFAGLSTKLESETARCVILGIGWVVFLGALVWMVTLPVELTT